MLSRQRFFSEQHASVSSDFPEIIGISLTSGIRNVGLEPPVYTKETFMELLKAPTCVKEKISFLEVNDSEQEYKVLRFLLRTDNTLVFGAEGGPSSSIPSHWQLASYTLWEACCITAGMAYFNQENQLCVLTNRSGDYRADFKTLRYIIPHLSDIPCQGSGVKFIEVNAKGENINVYEVDLESAQLSLISRNLANNP